MLDTSFFWKKYKFIQSNTKEDKEIREWIIRGISNWSATDKAIIFTHLMLIKQIFKIQIKQGKRSTEDKMEL